MGTRNASTRDGRGRRLYYITDHDRGGRYAYMDVIPSPLPHDPHPSPNDPYEVFAERLRSGPYNLSNRIPVNRNHLFHIMMEEEEFWEHGRTMSPALQHFVRMSPIRFSNRFNDDYSGRQLTPAEVETALRKIKKENYTPISRKSRKENMKEKEEEIDQTETPDTCSICLEDFFAKQQLFCLPCKHRFHPECVMPWIKRQGQCPVCRLDLSGRPPASAINNNHNNDVDQPQNLNANVPDDMALIIRAMEEALAWVNPYQR